MRLACKSCIYASLVDSVGRRHALIMRKIVKRVVAPFLDGPQMHPDCDKNGDTPVEGCSHK